MGDQRDPEELDVPLFPKSTGGESGPTEGVGTRKGTSSKRGSRQAKGQSKQPPASTNRGEDLERRVGRIEFAEGALVRLRVPVFEPSAEEGRRIVTDIDVLSFDVDLRLRTTVGVLECKSGAGGSGEPDRLLWLGGFKQLVGADRATLVRQTVTKRGLAIGRKLGLSLLDDVTLKAREADHAWMPERFGHVGGYPCIDAETRVERQLKGLREIPAGLVAFLRYGFCFADSHESVGALLGLRAAVERQGVLPEPTGTVLASHALIALVMSAVRDAGRLDSVTPATLRENLRLGLTVGSPTDTHLLGVLSTVDAIVRNITGGLHSAYQAAGAEQIAFEVPSIGALVAQAPELEIERYLDLVTRFRSNPATSRGILQTVELACFDALLGGDAWQSEAFNHLFTAEHRQLIVAALKTLEAIAGEAVAKSLLGLPKVPFDRVALAIPDRRSSPVGSGEHPRVVLPEESL